MFFVTPSETLGLSSLNAGRAADERLLTWSSAFDLPIACMLGRGALLQLHVPLPKENKCFLCLSPFHNIPVYPRDG